MQHSVSVLLGVGSPSPRDLDEPRRHIIASSICRPWVCVTSIMDAAQEYLKAQLLPQEDFAQGLSERLSAAAASYSTKDEAKIENSESIAPSAVGSRGPSRHRSPQAPGRHVAAPAVHHDLSSTWTSRTQRQPGGRGNEKAQDARSARPSTSSVPPVPGLVRNNQYW
eukprot:s2593_g2.t1